MHLPHKFVDLILSTQYVRQVFLLRLFLGSRKWFWTLCTFFEQLFLSFFFSEFCLLLSNFGLFFNLLWRFGFLLFEEKINYSRPHHRIAENTSCTWFCTSWEWWVIFILSSNLIRLTLAALFVRAVNSACIFKHSDSEFASVTFKTPLLFWMELHGEVTIETLDTEVDKAVTAFGLNGNFVGQQELFVCLWIVAHTHYR